MRGAWGWGFACAGACAGGGAGVDGCGVGVYGWWVGACMHACIVRVHCVASSSQHTSIWRTASYLAHCSMANS